MLIRKVEFIKLLIWSKPGVRSSFIFVEPLHLANYQIHRTSEFIEISNSWKLQIYRILDRVSVQSFTFIEAPQTPSRCSPFQNGGRGRIPGETETFSFRSCEKITIWWECRHCGLCDFPIAADKPPSCIIWQVQRSCALYISCYSFVRKCRRVWNKPY